MSSEKIYLGVVTHKIVDYAMKISKRWNTLSQLVQPTMEKEISVNFINETGFFK